MYRRKQMIKKYEGKIKGSSWGQFLKRPDVSQHLVFTFSSLEMNFISFFQPLSGPWSQAVNSQTTLILTTLSCFSSLLGENGPTRTWTSTQGSLWLLGHSAIFKAQLQTWWCKKTEQEMAHCYRATANTLTTQYMVRFSHLTVQLPETNSRRNYPLFFYFSFFFNI